MNFNIYIYPQSQIFNSAFLIGTPSELFLSLDGAGMHGRQFVDSIDAIILDEVDVLLPIPREYGKFGVHGGGGRRFGTSFSSLRKGSTSSSKNTKRKNPLPKTSTEKLLEFITLHNDRKECIIFGGSATASRKSLDRINSVLRSCDLTTGKATGWRGGSLRSIRISSPPSLVQSSLSSIQEEEDNMDFKPSHLIPKKVISEVNVSTVHNTTTTDEVSSHALWDNQSRYVLVPKQVQHRYVLVDKKYILDPSIILGKVSSLIKKLRPRSILIFICGSFVDKNGVISPSKDKNLPLLKKELNDKKKQIKKKNSNMPTLSAQKACDYLRSFNIEAIPLHLALGLDRRDNPSITHQQYIGNEREGGIEEEKMSRVLKQHSNVSSLFLSSHNQEVQGNWTTSSPHQTPPCFVTFEGLARGLHFQNVDTVFVIGRPSSVASYLHISGRVGRQSSTGVSNGTVVSICSNGGAKELSSWAKQIGAQSFELLEVPPSPSR